MGQDHPGFLDYLPRKLDEYDRMIMGNRIFRMRTKGIGACTLDEAIDWGMTGPNLRACGLEWDFRKKRPYSGYEHLEFESQPHRTATASAGPLSGSQRCARASG